MDYNFTNVNMGDHVLSVTNKKNFLDMALAFLKPGLKNNECLILLSEFSSPDHIIQMMEKKWKVSNIHDLYEKQIFIKSTKKTCSTEGSVVYKKIDRMWKDNLTYAKQNNFKGLRVVLDTYPLFEKNLGVKFIKYEATLDSVFTTPLTLLCIYEKKIYQNFSKEMKDSLNLHHISTIIDGKTKF